MKYLFCSFTSLGFLCPAIGIGKALQQRGHEVAFVTGLAGAPVLQQAGLKRIPRGAKDGPSFQIEQVGHPAEILRQIRHIEYALETFVPDVLVKQQLMVAPLIMGESHHIPVASIGTASYIWPTDMPPDYYPPAYYGLLEDHYNETFALYQSFSEMFSLPGRETPYDETPLIGDLLLLQSVAELEKDAHYLPDRVHLVGSCEWNPSQDDPELQRWLEDAIATNIPIIYLQMGTTFRFPSAWPCIAEVLGKQSVRVVASIGRMNRPPEPIPANFFVRNHVSQGQVLPYAHAVISSSTTTTVVGALARGVPLLLIPADGGEQTDLMLRCLQAEVAVAISPMKITNEHLAQKIDMLFNNIELHSKAASMRQSFSRATGPEGAADLLEVLGKEKRPVRRNIA